MRPVQYGNQPSLTSLLELFQRNIMSNLNCHQVGEIVSFNASTQTAEVSVKMSYTVNDKITEYPILLDCPCIILGGEKGRITFPISAGDSCLVLFNDRDIDNWYASGQTMPPRTGRKHSFSDAIALVGLHNSLNKITDYLTTGTELKYDNSTIKLESGKITVTNQTSSAVIDGNTLTVTAPIININGNMNVVQNTVDNNSLTAYVIETYHSSTSWYRVYSDKWSEQGGYSTSPQVAFKKEMADSNYTIMITSYRNGQQTSGDLRYITSFSPTGFTKSLDSNETFWWEVKGYIK